MFRRNNSRLEHRGALRRSKSTGSVAISHHNRGFANLELHPAHRDAHIAARVSFTKAREESDRSSSTGIPASLSTNGLTRSDSFMKGPDVISYNGDKSEAAASKAYSSLCRQRSIRFTGPTARKKRVVAIRANGSWADHSDICGRMHPSAFGGRLPKSSPLAGHAYDDFWLDRSLDIESKNEETVCESEQSFYPVQRQKLRKSRSMFNGSFMSSECHSETVATASSGWNGRDPSKHAVIVASTNLDAEWEPQRLSVIDEGGHAISTLERWRSSEDEERAYSALVQRLDDMQKQQNREASFRGEELNDNFGGSIGQSTAGIDATISAITSNGGTQGETEYNYNGGVIPHEYDLKPGPFFSATNSEVTSPTGHLFRTQSPYRRALRKSMRIQERSSSIKPVNLRYLSSLSALSLPTRRSSPEESERDIRLSSAESVYSNLSASLEKPGNSESGFDMGEFDTIMLSSPHNREREAAMTDTLGRSRQRQVSTASSVEWKTWLSAKVSKLEDYGEASKVLGEEQTWNPWSAMGHVRENAEIGPNSNASDTSDADNRSFHGSRNGQLDLSAQPATQSIVIEDDVVYHSQRMLTHDENAPPEYKTKKAEDFEQHPKAIRSVSSLPNVNLSEVYETRCRKSITPQKPKGSPSALADSPSRPKKAYMNSGAASSLKSSPGLSAAVRRQFGTVATGSPGRRSIRGGEDVAQSRVVREATSFEDCQFGRGLDAQAMGSKRMVELFLNSRKSKRTSDAGADWPGAFV
ncbi:hypothetical protein ARSEF4850_002893 [Beauveria asiatica]